MRAMRPRPVDSGSLFSLLVLLPCMALFSGPAFLGQAPPAAAPAQPESAAAAPSGSAARQALPAEWEGVWKGTTVRVQASGEREEVPTELHVRPLPGGEARTWRILYGAGAGQETPPYEIAPVPGEPGHFVVDEKNGLLIDQQLVGRTLYALFLVTTNLVSARYDLRGNEIEVELTMYDAREPRRSKLTGGNVEVSSYRFRSVQRGALTRQE